MWQLKAAQDTYAAQHVAREDAAQWAGAPDTCAAPYTVPVSFREVR